MSFAARHLVPVALAASLLSGCEGDSVCVRTPPPVLTMNPASLVLPTGDSAPLTMTVHDASERTMVRLASQSPGVARVDSVARSGVPTVVRAGAAGSTVVTVIVTHDGQTVSGYVPVTVTARPTS
jgi:hypothetical protein